MGKGACRIAFTGMMTMLPIVGTQRAVSAAPDERTVLRVAVVNHAGVPEDVWQRAQTTASRIYEAAGIHVLWIDSATTGGISASRSDLTVIVSAAPSAPGLTSSKHVLGFALQARNRGRLAYAFFGRIQGFARDTRADAGKMLGHVIAHETGHLLLGREAHALVGLMRGRWHEAQAELVSAGILTFTNDEAAAIRARVIAVTTGLSAER
jgi:hypothetical protein